MYFFRTISVKPKLPEQISRLQELAYNLWFSWNSHAQLLFQRINSELWEEVYHNPVKFLLHVKRKDLEAVAHDPAYLDLYRRVFTDFDYYLTADKWFQQQHPELCRHTIAYFSAEFGFHESLPIYSGGLGVLAGDHCKSASDLGLPFVAVGLLYKHGYFTQKINRDGWQEAVYPHLNFYEMPIQPVARQDGCEATISVDLPGRTVYAKLWQAQVGQIRVILLDADVALNRQEDRKLTGQLYGGGLDTRISQEILLGIGGVKALRSLGINPDVWHINEGHSAFLTLERVRELVQNGIPVTTAREVIRASTIFTTHTPVPAGHDIFPAEMIDHYLGHLYRQLGMDRDAFLELGWDRDRNGFNMTLLAMNLAGYCNGVSRLHGEVTRKMFRWLYGMVPVEEIPITFVTNGIHMETWLAQELNDLLTTHLGADWKKHLTEPEWWEKISTIPDEKLWQTHQTLKGKTIQFVRDSLVKQRSRNHESVEQIREVQDYLNPQALTIGFARRFATYKRATLLFRDRERLIKMLNDPERPLQIIFAGKAHPADQPGKELIKQIYDISNEEPFRGKVVFLENYDINLARHLTHGVDIWLNTPRWPMEASGTSGMKAALNGVLHCSVLDGWWPEAYNGENGFAIGEEKNYLNDEEQDKDDVYSLYSLLENFIIPTYYKQEDGLPREWIKLMKASLRTIPWQFSTERMVQEYAERFYVQAIARGLTLTQENFQVAADLHSFKRFIQENWHHVTITAVEAKGNHVNVGDELEVNVRVKLGPISHEAVQIELAYGQINNNTNTLQNLNTTPMKFMAQDGEGTYRFTGRLPLKEQGTLGYTVRIRPAHPHFAHHFELPLVTWAPCF
ncbi:MAG: alpha-glucan family phosphorylase [Firmicutes bacterium]|nr:alpha-glucan family phosphorylase [Bacillota bacterium]